jgi:hypothetical protein
VAGETSDFSHLLPRHAVAAAGHPHKAYDRQVERIANQINERRQLPRTQMDFYEYRQQQQLQRQR